MVPQLRSTDLAASIAFYVDTLGFELAFQHADFYAGIRAGAQLFHLKLVDQPDPAIGWVQEQTHFDLYFEVDDVDAVASRLRDKRIPFVREPHHTSWGTRELVIRDDQGHTLHFGQPAIPRDDHSTACAGDTMPQLVDGTTQMFRPVGPRELELLRGTGFRRWPARLPDQPIFYPVTNARYAAQISRQWNVMDYGHGAVTRFHVDAGFMARYPVRWVGAMHHTEWWVPAEDLEALNDHIVGSIEVIEEFSR